MKSLYNLYRQEVLDIFNNRFPVNSLSEVKVYKFEHLISSSNESLNSIQALRVIRTDGNSLIQSGLYKNTPCELKIQNVKMFLSVFVMQSKSVVNHVITAFRFLKISIAVQIFSHNYQLPRRYQAVTLLATSMFL